MVQIRPQRWRIQSANPDQAADLAAKLNLHPLIAQLLINRGIDTPEAALIYLDPSQLQLPDPCLDFPDLSRCVDHLATAIQQHQSIAICGDYDADGMTSTAVLLRTFRHLGAQADYEIPSRMTEGYGINTRIVADLHQRGIQIIITVDNGIAALEPIQLAKDLGLTVLVTDHHDLPAQLPPADAILNPKMIPETSPYRGMAGVGVAYLLALALAERMGSRAGLERPLLELLTLGTIADMAPLIGVNRHWVKQGLDLLPTSGIPGIRALMQVSGLEQRWMAGSSTGLKPEAIGFGLGPRINAVGRLAQPRVVIELLTTEDPEAALSLAQECEDLNQERQRLCKEIEQAAIDQIESSNRDLSADRVLTVLGQDWHHGVIGIVASRLVERYGAPVFIGSELDGEIRGSARGIPEFNVFEALESCRDLFCKHGGHPAAGGFSMVADRWPELEAQLQTYAQTVLDPEHICPLIQIDAAAELPDLDYQFYEQLQILQPCGIGNAEPLLWTANLNVIRQQLIGKDRSHVKLQLQDLNQRDQHHRPTRKTALLWGAGSDQLPLPAWVDLAYSIRLNVWNGETEIQLEVKGIRPAQAHRDSCAGQLPLWQLQPAIPSTLASPPSPFSTTMPTSNRKSRRKLHPPEDMDPTLTPNLTGDPDPVIDQDAPLDPECADPSSALPEPILIYKRAPAIPYPLEWHDMDRLSTRLPECQGTALLYGYRRPELCPDPVNRDPSETAVNDLHARNAQLPLTIHYDRPLAGHHYDQILLWSWPPSITHLAWLLASAQPAGSTHQIYVHYQRVPLISSDLLRRQLRAYLQAAHAETSDPPQVDLLRLAQQWWLAPSTLVAGLRSLGYCCLDFGNTGSVPEELRKLDRWFSLPWSVVATMLEKQGVV